jgi:hypothetical protein
MNKVDIYVNGFRLDIFDDEQISINLSVQNVQDISKVFTDFTQGFTVPASPNNNEILQHYYNPFITSSSITTRTSGQDEWQNIFTNWESYNTIWNAGGTTDKVVNTFDARFRQPARIEINSLPFRTGVIELDSVQLKGTEPYAYSLTFYGDVVGLSDLFAEDYLYDLNFSAYNHAYTDDAVFDRVTTNTYAPIFYPLMSPVRNWYYNSANSDHDPLNIHYHTGGGHGSAHGINYYELKPAIKVTTVLDAIEAKYGITFTGSFISSAPFTDLALWLHRREGYLYDNQPTATSWELIDFTDTNSPTPDYFDLTTETWTPVGLSGTGDLYDVAVSVTISAYTDDYFIGVFRNGTLISEATANGTATTTLPDIPVTNNVESLQIKIRPSTNVAMTYEVTQMTITNSSAVTSADVYMAASASYALAEVVITDLMPEIKVKDFLAGLIKMHNLVIVPNNSSSFLLQPLEDWYDDGTAQDYQTYLDITQYTVNRPPIYREIEFNYQETEQILGAQYRNTNNTGFGDLRAFFNFDADTLQIEIPFECPLFERLTDQFDGSLTNVMVYKSITNELDDDGVTFKPYLGAPILFYAKFGLDISGNSVSFIDSNGTDEREINDCWYANTSNSFTSVAQANSICFGADIDPFFLQSVSKSLYYNYWTNYITDLYAKSRRLYRVEAVLPMGEIIKIDLKNQVIWNNQKFIVNTAQLNMTTGKATFELLNVV